MNEYAEPPMAQQKNKQRPDELIESSQFKNLSVEARATLVFNALALHPRFAYEVASFAPAFFVAKRHYLRDSYPQRDGSILEEALGLGHLSVVRTMIARMRRVARQTQDEGSPSMRLSEDWTQLKLFNKLYASPVGDEQAWSARTWLRPDRHAKSSAKAIASEAALCFAHGRPELGLRLCRELTAFPPALIAEATAPSIKASLPASMPMIKVDWSKADPVRPLSPQMWRTGLPGSNRYDSRDDTLTVESLSRCALLPLAQYWSNLLDAGHKARPELEMLEDASKSLAQVADKLWASGALTSPSDYAERFAQAPIEADSPQIKQLAKLDAHSAALAIHGAWIKAASQPRILTGKGILWDAFVKAHADLDLGVQSNPFAFAHAGQTPALWSLHADGELIQLGIERGFKPKDHSRLLVKPGASGRAAHDKKSTQPGFLRNELSKDWEQRLACENFIASNSCTGAAPKSGSEHRSKWLHTNLSTAALICGHVDLAMDLIRAGCEIPDTALASHEMAELGLRGRDAIGEFQSRCDAFAIRASLAADEPKRTTPSGKKKAKTTSDNATELAPATTPSAPKRRILKA